MRPVGVKVKRELLIRSQMERERLGLNLMWMVSSRMDMTLRPLEAAKVNMSTLLRLGMEEFEAHRTLRQAVIGLWLARGAVALAFAGLAASVTSLFTGEAWLVVLGMALTLCGLLMAAVSMVIQRRVRRRLRELE